MQMDFFLFAQRNMYHWVNASFDTKPTAIDTGCSLNPWEKEFQWRLSLCSSIIKCNVYYVCSVAPNQIISFHKVESSTEFSSLTS